MDSTNTVGYNALTPLNLLIDAGALYKNYGLETEKLISATSGGNKFNVKLEYRDIKCDGVKGDAKGLKRLVKATITLESNLLEATTETLAMMVLGEVDDTTNPDYDIITGKTYIADADYLENVALVGALSGSLKPIIIIVKNALSTDGLSLETKDDDDNVLPTVWTGHIDPNSPKVLPYEIRYPKADALAPLYLENDPIMSGGEIQLDFNTSTAEVVPFTGFAVLVGGVANIVTGATRNVNNLSLVDLTLTTPLTSGEVVTVAYTKPVTVEEQVTALSGGALATFPASTVTNN